MNISASKRCGNEIRGDLATPHLLIYHARGYHGRVTDLGATGVANYEPRQSTAPITAPIRPALPAPPEPPVEAAVELDGDETLLLM